MSKRVAVCFSGQLRNVKSTYEIGYKPNMWDTNTNCQIDVFGHSWYDKNTTGMIYTAANRMRNTIPACSPVPSDIIQQVYESYNPIQLYLQQQLVFDEKDYNERKLPDAVPEHGLSRLYSIQRANEARLQHERNMDFVYDLVIFTRYDFVIMEKLLFDVIGKETGIFHLGYSPHNFNVCFTMGDPQSMTKYAQLYNDIESVYKRGVFWCDELLALNYLQYQNIPIYDLTIRNMINRGDVSNG